MADYKQTTVTGTSWKRARNLTIYNMLGGTPSIAITEEEAFILSGRVVLGSDSTFLNADFNPTESFHIINPITGEDTGTTATHQDIYVMLHSLYTDLATKRDTSVIPPPQ